MRLILEKLLWRRAARTYQEYICIAVETYINKYEQCLDRLGNNVHYYTAPCSTYSMFSIPLNRIYVNLHINLHLQFDSGYLART